MTQAESRAAFNDAIRTRRLAGKRFNVELEQIAAAKHKGNRNGAEPERVKCFCNEGIANGRRVAVHRPCDCEYTAQPSALVYEASRITTERLGDPTGHNALGYVWTKEFTA